MSSHSLPDVILDSLLSYVLFSEENRWRITEKLVLFTRTRLSFEKSLFSSLLYLFVLKIVTHLIFQEEKPVGARGADRTPAKTYVSSVIFAPSQQTFF